MNEKNVLLTGGSRGIGKAIKDKFIKNGYIVYSPSRDELDLSRRESIDRYRLNNKDVYFSVIINNAGINDINLIENVTTNEIENMLQVDLIAPMLLLKYFIPKMKINGYGKIVNIGSIWAVVSKPGRSLYAAAKNGLHGITNTLALELGEYGILVNTVCPGFTLTELTKKNNSKEEIENINKAIPLKRMANPEEIAELVFFLGSEKNSYITGQKISIDGGYTVQ